jgi:hypothetical protein
MPYSGMLRRVALVRTDVSEELSAFIIRVTRISELGTTLAITSNRTANIVPCSPILITLMMEALGFSETSVVTRVTRRNIPEDGILRSHRLEDLKSYSHMGLCIVSMYLSKCLLGLSCWFKIELLIQFY